MSIFLKYKAPKFRPCPPLIALFGDKGDSLLLRYRQQHRRTRSLEKNYVFCIRKRRPDIHIVILAAYPQIAFEDYFIQSGCEVTHLPPKGKSPLKYYKALIDALSHHQEGDILKINACSYRNYLLSKAAKKARIKTIVVGHLSSSVSFPEIAFLITDST